MSKRLGYVVVTRLYNQPLGLSSNGVLYNRRTATTFRTLREANRAINRTLEHSAERGFGWTASSYAIVAVGEVQP